VIVNTLILLCMCVCWCTRDITNAAYVLLICLKKFLLFIVLRYFYRGRVLVDNGWRTGIGTYIVWYDSDAEQRPFP
jgi:hypothetical protein